MSGEHEHYGTEWRPWPTTHDPDGHCCAGADAGYWSDYRHLFATAFAYEHGRYLLCVEQDDAGDWRWRFGSFSWTPDGNLFDAVHYGRNATRARAESECRLAVESWERHMEATR